MTTLKDNHKTIWIKAETHQGLVDATKGKESFDATISRILKVYQTAIECGLVD